MLQKEFLDLIELYLGSSASIDEIVICSIVAAQKNEQIVSRYGDLNGERNKPYYQAQLVAEQIQSKRLGIFLDIVEINRNSNNVSFINERSF